MSKWKPSPSDIEWTKNHIEQLSEGGVWAIPAANNSRLTLYHSTKSYDAVILATLPSEQETMLRTMTVLKILGYLANTILWDGIGSGESRLNRFQNENV
jgi:hypothetical protein